MHFTFNLAIYIGIKTHIARKQVVWQNLNLCNSDSEVNIFFYSIFYKSIPYFTICDIKTESCLLIPDN